MTANGIAEIRKSPIAALSPAVSVVVSTYNHASMLASTVRAVMNQDLKGALEMIVCDDASTDGTHALMLELIETARQPLTYIRLARNSGPAIGRNVALEFAQGRFIAFTDSDCIPAPSWLQAALDAFVTDDIGIVQGQTVAELQQVPLFEHHVATSRLEGTFPTANVVYRATAIRGHRFNPECWSRRATWEDADLAWRVQRAGWRAVYASEALVAHKVIPLSPLKWVFWASRYRKWPAISARYPGFRRHLFLGVWIRPLHLLFQLALLGLAFAWRQPITLLLVAPYAVAFARCRGLSGRFPPAKLAAYLAWDSVACVSLLAGSLRYRSVVL